MRRNPTMKLVSWNVNGLRACLGKGFQDVFDTLDADVFCLQETKMQPGQAEFAPEGYTEYLYSAEKKGYSGTAIWAKQPALSVRYGIGHDIVSQLYAAGTRVHSFARSTTGTDVGSRESVAEALQGVAKAEGRIDYIINTAGVLNKEPLHAMEQETIEAAVRTNYMGTVNVALEAYPYLKETRGKLVFFTSSSYTRGRAFYSIYSSTKAAIVNFVQAVAQEWEAAGIAVNCINPERTKTPMRVKNFGTEPDDTLLRSEDVAEVTVRSLLSDYTGQVIDVKRKK